MSRVATRREQRQVLRAINEAEGRMLPPGWDAGLESQFGQALTTGPELDHDAHAEAAAAAERRLARQRAHPPLRLIRKPEPFSPPPDLETRNDVDHAARRRVAIGFLLWCAAWLAGAAWFAFN